MKDFRRLEKIIKKFNRTHRSNRIVPHFYFMKFVERYRGQEENNNIEAYIHFNGKIYHIALINGEIVLGSDVFTSTGVVLY